jgi:3-phosphoinositide dependent protein kinase-1
VNDEVILESGLVWKRKGRSVKKRQLILTNTPRIIYIDTKKMVLKGEIPWSSLLRPEAKNNVSWFIHTVCSKYKYCTDSHLAKENIYT